MMPVCLFFCYHLLSTHIFYREGLKTCFYSIEPVLVIIEKEELALDFSFVPKKCKRIVNFDERSHHFTYRYKFTFSTPVIFSCFIV